jgi:hypothetical protein
MRYRFLLAVVAGCALAAGCSSSGAGKGSKVTGKVTLNGKAVADARVIFTDGAATSMAAGPTALTDDSGQYALVGVKPGSYKVVVYKLVSKKGVPVPTDEEGLDLPQLEASGMGTHVLPQKYARVTSTTLVAQVDDGTNEVDLKLTGQ